MKNKRLIFICGICLILMSSLFSVSHAKAADNPNQDKIKLGYIILKNQGYSDSGALATLGIIGAESNYNHNALIKIGDDVYSYGLFQWSNNKLAEYYDWCDQYNKCSSIYRNQLYFYIYDVKNNYKNLDAILRSNKYNKKYISSELIKHYIISKVDYTDKINFNEIEKAIDH